jgi:uncharacterized protein
VTYKEKKKKLLGLIDEYAKQDIAVAFSGGVDSSLLLKIVCEATKKWGTKVYAVTMHTKLHPMKDVEIAKKVAAEVGAEHEILYVDELAQAGIENNPENRCYLCKKFLFTKAKEVAEQKGVTVILDGTNEDDLHQYRPGIQALKELGVCSPIAAAGMTKEEVRKLAKEYEISVSNRPSTPCMATRFPYGDALSYEKMNQLEEGEEYLRGKGFYNVRLRLHGDILRVEVDEESMEKLLSIKKEVTAYFKGLGFLYITLDLEGFRSGSMDIKITKES